MKNPLLSRQALTWKILPVLAALVFVKWLLVRAGWQPFELNTLVSSMLAANVFLLGFLISGAMPDYKEAERIPGEMAVSIDAIADELFVLRQKVRGPANVGLSALAASTKGLHDWFHRREKSGDVMEYIGSMSEAFAGLEPHTQANFIVRLKQEQSQLRRLLTRAHSIRETSFAKSAYAIAELFTALMVLTLLAVELPTLAAALWFTFLGSLLLVYMLLLIHDLDNPFHYGPQEGDDEVPLRPLEVVFAKVTMQKP